jgi:hypothetical protein
LHTALLALYGASIKDAGMQSAPVTDDKPVVPVSIDKKVKDKTDSTALMFGGGGLGTTSSPAPPAPTGKPSWRLVSSFSYAHRSSPP